jgi:sensor histidine kinase YesM
MQIEIMGKVLSDNRWMLTFKDNGSGFKDETLLDLNSRINNYKEKVMKNQKPEELSIGGMGIINTFVRLGLYFGENATFDLCNMTQGGAQITIICPIKEDAQEGEHD